jgi:hypothetical protein
MEHSYLSVGNSNQESSSSVGLPAGLFDDGYGDEVADFKIDTKDPFIYDFNFLSFAKMEEVDVI